MPFALRIAVLVIVGGFVGSLINWGAYRLGWKPRAISPWSRPDGAAPRRRWTDRIPIVGWLGLAREARLFGAGFWIRPMLVELAAAIGLAGLYWWEFECRGLWRTWWPVVVIGQAFFRLTTDAPLASATLAAVAAHAVLLALLATASLIDLDERSIPDSITVPGTVVGLLAAMFYPWSMLPGGEIHVPADAASPLSSLVAFLTVASPLPWPGALAAGRAWALAAGWGCFWLGIAALLPRPWRLRRGWGVAIWLLAVRMKRGLMHWPMLALAIAGTGAIGWAWRVGGPGWIGLLSALVGMAGGGLMIWLVRVIGTSILGREAMGFGDVTLMAMIGSFLGWQPCLLVFFLAPLLALGFGLARFFLRGDAELCYGPFLCLAAGVVVVRWADVWEWAMPIFSLGWLVPLFMAVAFVLMAILLGALRWLRG
jgi:prepilin signal peptidase PulO-like enzyme (type II secretory pathway)